MTGSSTSDVYTEIGVRPIINCQGNRTTLGGSSPSPEVMQAMETANGSYVVMSELLEKAGEYVAQFMGVESAFITSGCAAGLALCAAACIAGKDQEKRGQLPDSTGMRNEILIQKKQRYSYDRAYAVGGGKLVEVGDVSGCTVEQLEGAIGPNTAAIAYLVQPEDSTLVSQQAAVKLAHAHGIPVIADAAAQIYPVDYLLANARSADLVCFGAKYFGAPTSSGVVCGKRELVEAVAGHGYIAFQNQPDGQRAFGRPMKVDRQSVIAVIAALKTWLTMNHEDRLMDIDSRLSSIQRQLSGILHVSTEIVNSGHYWGNGLHVVLDTKALGKTAEEVAIELDAGNPRIWVGLGAGDSGDRLHGFQGGNYQHDPRLSDDTFVINVHALNEGEDQIVAERVRSVLTG